MPQNLGGGHEAVVTLHGFNACVTCVTSTTARLTSQCRYRTDTPTLPAPPRRHSVLGDRRLGASPPKPRRHGDSRRSRGTAPSVRLARHSRAGAGRHATAVDLRPDLAVRGMVSERQGPGDPARSSSPGAISTTTRVVDSDQGDHDEWNIRRMRLGARVTMFRTFLLHAEVELNPQEHDPLYVRFTDFYLQWSRNPRLVITGGKQGVPFTSEGATSSRELVAIDRSNLANNIWFPQEYMTGLSVSGRVAPWVYRAGVYSSGAMNREFGEFNGGVFTLALLGYDFGPASRTARSARDRKLPLSAGRSEQHLHPAVTPHPLDAHPVRGPEVGPAHGRLEGDRLPRSVRPLERHGDAVLQRDAEVPARRAATRL